VANRILVAKFIAPHLSQSCFYKSAPAINNAPAMNTHAKHRLISQQLASEIVSGKYGADGRLPSETQLVQRFGASRPTVGRALRELEQQGMITRRQGAGTFVRSSSAATGAAASGLPQLGIIIPALRHTEIFEAICGELASLARVHDFLFWSENRPALTGESLITVEQAEELSMRFVERGVAGAFFVPFEHRADREAANRQIAERLKQAGIPVVLLDRDLGAFPRRSEYDIVGVDNFAGGYALAEHLIKLGARRLGYVMRPLTASTVDARIAGARIAMQAHGLNPAKNFVQTGDPLDIKFVRSIMQSKSFDALLCTSDHLAAQLLQSLNRLGVQVPRDVRLVGFDNVPFANLLTVPLTTVEQPCRDIATVAFSALRERLTNAALPARTLLVAPRLVVRESCGAYL